MGNGLFSTGLCSLLAYCNESQTFLYRNLLRFLALRVQLVVFAGAFGTGSTFWSVSCFCSSTLGVPVPIHLYKWGLVSPSLRSRRHFRGTVSHQKQWFLVWMHSVTRTIFPVFEFKVMHGMILLNSVRLTRVAVLSGEGTSLKCLNDMTPLPRGGKWED